MAEPLSPEPPADLLRPATWAVDSPMKLRSASVVPTSAAVIYRPLNESTPGGLVYVLAEGLILQTNALHGTGRAFMHMEFDIFGPT